MDKISAFMDGESAPAEAQQTLKRLHNDAACQDIWNCFHLVGDVMRGDPVLRGDFLDRVRERMDSEPTVLAPRIRWRAPTTFAYSAAAAIAGVAVVLGIVLTNNPLRPEAPPLEAKAQPAANPAQVNEYLMAHQEFSPRTALQGVVPYVRSVSASHDGNRR